MPILFVDGCDHSLSVAEKRYVSTMGTNSGASYSNASFRTGTRSLLVTVNNYNSASGYITQSINATTTPRVAFGFNLNNQPANLITFRDGATEHVSLRANLDGSLTVYRGGPTGTLLGTSSVIFNKSIWNHIEFAVTISDTVGTVDVWLNNVSVLSLTSQDTRNGGNAQVTGIAIGTSVFPSTFGATGRTDNYWDDIVMSDDASTRIGTAVVQTLYPTGAGATTQWTPSTGNNWAAVDEAAANSDTDYVSTSTANNIDTYAMGNLSNTSGTILALAVNLVARDDAGGSNSIAAVVRSGGTDYAQASVATTAGYLNYQTVISTDPATSSAWTGTNVNAVELGVKRI